MGLWFWLQGEGKFKVLLLLFPSMEAMPPASSSLSDHQETPAHDEFSVQQSLLFSDSLKDLKNLRSQLYSAAEYFELSYTNDDQKEIVVSTLRDYATKALVNAVDHLGSVSYKVDGFLSDQFDEVYGAELRVSCIEQRIRTCQDYIDRQGLSQQSLLITAAKYHKRYILPGACMVESTSQASPMCQKLKTTVEDKEPQEFQTAVRSTIRGIPPLVRKTRSPSPSPQARSSSPRKARCPSPSARRGRIFTAEKRSVSPLPTSIHFSRSGSLSCRPIGHNSSMGKQYPQEPNKSAPMRLPPAINGHKDIERNSSKGRNFLKGLLSRRRTRDDEMLYTYLDEY